MRNEKGSGELGILVALAAGVAAIAWRAGLVLGLSAAVSGCFGPLILGVKKHTHSDGSITEFITGADFTIGANGTDSVSNFRGIEPQKYDKKN